MKVDKEKCIGCKTCHPYCTVGAITLIEWEGKKKSEVNQSDQIPKSFGCTKIAV